MGNVYTKSGARVVSGWDGPVNARWMMNLNLLPGFLRNASPVGKHSHDKGIPYVNFTPRAGGRLRSSWKLAGIHRDRRYKKVAIIISEPTVYAFIQNEGGKLPPVSGKRMVWNDNGKIITAYQRKGYSIEGKHFIEKAIDAWIKYISVEWLPSPSSPEVVD